MQQMVRHPLYGIGTFIPIVFITLSLAVIGIMTLTMGNDAISVPVAFTFLAIELIGVILGWFYIITMIIDAIKHLSGVEMVVWILLLYAVNLFVFPIYWFAYVRKRTD